MSLTDFNDYLIDCIKYLEEYRDDCKSNWSNPDIGDELFYDTLEETIGNWLDENKVKFNDEEEEKIFINEVIKEM